MVAQVGGRESAGVAGERVVTLEAASQEQPSEVPTREWLLVYVRAGKRLPWLRVLDVPADVPRADVLAALETWRRWSAYAPGPGRTSLVLASRPGALVRSAEGCFAVPWSDLRPETVKTSIELPGDVHAQIVLAARQRGMTQAAWMAEQLAVAVTVALGAAAGAPGGRLS